MGKNFLKIIEIKENSIVPKYKQLMDGILHGVETGLIKENEILPSIHDLCMALNLSKNTVEKAYFKLKRKGIVGSVPGKGYYLKCAVAIE